MQKSFAAYSPLFLSAVGAFAVSVAVAQSNLPNLAEIKVAAENGDPVAQDRLGESYLGRLNFSAAAEWFCRAADRGIVNSQWRLGQILLEGRPKVAQGSVAVAADKDAGIKWLLLAANQGNSGAQLDLGQWFERRQDYVEAHKWYKLGARNNPLTEKMRLEPLILKMSSDQIREGQKRAEQFVPHMPSKKEMPEPQYLADIVLKGISGLPSHRLALINNQTIAQDEEGNVKVGLKTLRVKVLEIKERSAIILIKGTSEPKEITMRQ